MKSIKLFFLKESRSYEIKAAIYNKRKDLEYLDEKIKNLQRIVAAMKERLKKELSPSPEYQRWLTHASPEALFRRDAQIEEDERYVSHYSKEISKLNEKRKMLIDEIEQLQANEIDMSHPKDEEWDL